MLIPRRAALRSLSAAALAPVLMPSFAQAYPNRMITVVVPWPAGAATDAATRIIAEAMAKEMGQPVVVDNRPGASGAIGCSFVAKGPKDGYRLITATADTHTINPQVRKSLSYDARKDFESIALFATMDMVWVARPDLSYKSMAEVLAAARQLTTPMSYGTWGVGSTAHLAGALLEMASGLSFNHVPFQGAAPALTALAGGHVDLVPTGRMTAATMRAAGKVKILGIASQRRASGELSDVLTLEEQGIKGAEARSWYGLMAPKNIPDEVRARLVEAIGKVLASPDISARIAGTGLDPMPLTGADFLDFLRQQWDATGRVVHSKKIYMNE